MSKTRILVLENDADLLEDIIQTLRTYSHTVEGSSTLEGLTVENIQQRELDLVLVDGRMVDDVDPHDQSGEAFAEQLGEAGIPVVLLTAHLPPRTKIFRLLRSGRLAGAVSKRVLLGQDFVAAVDQYGLARRFPNGIGRFYRAEDGGPVPSFFWDRLLENMPAPTGAERASGSELRVLLRSLISPCATRVFLEPAMSGQSGTGILRVRVSCGDGPVTEPLAVKYGRKTSILSESMRYDRHVGPLADGSAAQLRWRAETESLGAIAYSWVGDSEEDGVALGTPDGSSGLSWRRRRAAVHRLFTVALRPWHDVYRSPLGKAEDPRELIEYYTGESGLWYGERQTLQELSSVEVDPHPFVALGEDSWDFGEYGGILPNPYSILASGTCQALAIDRFCPSHGDLHVGNIFVLPDDSPRLIDFGKTDMGHIFRDFAALETSLRLIFAQPATTLQVKRAEDLVCETRSLGDHISYRALGGGVPGLVEALRTTTTIRRTALDAAGRYLPQGARTEYLIALILHMLKYAYGGADEVVAFEPECVRKSRMWHALYAAARAAVTLRDTIDDDAK